ncbi:MAG TPA: 5-oxoprolinase subunit PxpB [Candidatus Acidoferrum sp.]|jgi:inhibitor of KinA
MPVQFQMASDQSLLVSFSNKVTLDAHQSVRKLLRLLAAEPVPAIRNLHPAYNSILIQFDALKMEHRELKAILRKYLQRMRQVKLAAPREIEIPVCYGGVYGPDLTEVAALHGLAADKVIELHSSRTYIVYFLGFVPGFAYLGELAAELFTPRMQTPRRAVPAGSVGIAGNQTGVYPFATPGGWRILGRTPAKMFRADNDTLSLLSVGDRVRFRAISAEEFAAWESM